MPTTRLAGVALALTISLTFAPALGAQNGASIARRDPDRELRKKAIFWLGQSNDPRVRDFLLEIINGPR